MRRFGLRPSLMMGRPGRPSRRPTANPWRSVFANRPRQDGQGYVSGALLGGYVVEPGDGRRLAANAWCLCAERRCWASGPAPILPTGPVSTPKSEKAIPKIGSIALITTDWPTRRSGRRHGGRECRAMEDVEL